MSGELVTGLAGEAETVVTETHTAGHLGSGDVRVLAFPMMILFMEITARKLLAAFLPAGRTSFDSRVNG